MPPVRYHIGRFPPAQLNWLRLRLTCGRGRVGSVLVFPSLINRAEGKDVF